MADDEPDRRDSNDQLTNAISAVLPPLLAALRALDFVGRHLHPPHLVELAAAVLPVAEPVRAGLAEFRAASFPAHLQEFRQQVLRAADSVCEGIDLLQAAASGSGSDGPMSAYRAMGRRTRAVEALYPLASVLAPVSRFFLEDDRGDDEALLRRLHEAGAKSGARTDVGITHFGNDRSERGGWSLYVPEYYQDDRAHPLIVALHGGSGHGRDFLWTWIVEARSRGLIVLSPTARDRTWSLMGPDIDSANIEAMVAETRRRFHLDERRLLLTGMSDGGTFCYVSGLREESPFTHLAPCSASFHPLLLDGTSRQRLAGLPIYLMHGALDWMFPVDVARTANAALSHAGARVAYREIDDLSHTWPRDENPRIAQWLADTERPGVELRPDGSG